MSDYMDKVFGPDGILAQRFEGYAPRPGQIALARAVDAAIADGVHLMAEGPTGTGKSIGYAVPASYRAAHGKKRVVIATANIALQEQLVGKDLPLLADVLPWKFTFALLKGRNNYLCVDRIYDEKARGTFDLLDDPDDAEMHRHIAEWASTTATGDMSDLPFQPPARLWRKFSTTSDDCKGNDCRYREDCFALKARAAAEEAQVVVTNYHLLFAHLQVREATGLDLVLPPFDVAICDEGHKAADIARDFFGFRVTFGSVRWVGRLLGKLKREKLARKLEEAASRYFNALTDHRASRSYSCRLRRPDPVPWMTVTTALRETASAYSAAMDRASDSDARAEIERAHMRATTLAGQIEAAMTLQDEGSVYFIDEGPGGRAVLRSKPIEVNDRLRRVFFEPAHSVVVTSATLSVGGKFDHIAGELGVPEPRGIVAETPFDFEEQALLVVPDGLPAPNDPDFTEAVTEAVARIIELADGRTLGLFTSYRNLNATYDRVAGDGYRVLRQGEMPRTALVAEFRNDVRSVLLGTESFWAGVDVPGEALSCVVIDRLPFASPDDPVLDAVSERDRNWFRSYSLPRAIIAFKQGFGRLIRTCSDRGVVVVLDQRLVTKSYGRLFIASLPSLLKSRRIESVQQFMQEAA